MTTNNLIQSIIVPLPIVLNKHINCTDKIILGDIYTTAKKHLQYHRSNREIAKWLGVSTATASKHIQSLKHRNYIISNNIWLANYHPVKHTTYQIAERVISLNPNVLNMKGIDKK